MLRRISATLLLLLAGVLPAAGQLPCNPCVGLATDDPAGTAELLATLPALPEEAVLVVKWPVELADDAAAATARDAAAVVRTAGAIPWYAVRFATPPPSAEAGDELTPELERLADIARSAPAGSLFQLVWPGELLNEPRTVQEYALALKRASVAVSGAQPDASVVTESLPPDPELVRALYAQELDAYLDGVAFRPGRGAGAAGVAELKELIRELDPDALVALEANAATAGGEGATLVRAAAEAEAGASLSLFPLSGEARADAATVRAARLIAQEFSGDVTFDP
ncbi:MAG: hypothetical protein OXU63_12465, partial [Acidobacteriota bacterium]|nr:hypothetical protein [Acidobacteriota bacterium]